MAKPFSRILDQIARLQKEAATIQTRVIDRIRKEIAEYSLTTEQLFGASGAGRPAAATKSKAKAKAKPPKFADGAGNTWGGMGKRPEWLRQALEAGNAIEDFRVSKPVKAVAVKKAASKSPLTKSVSARKPLKAASKKASPVAAKNKSAPAKNAAPAKKVAAKKAVASKWRQTKAAGRAAEAPAS